MNIRTDIIIFLIVLALVSTAVGGWLDITRNDSFFITKEHAWNDGKVLLLLAITLLCLRKHG